MSEKLIDAEALMQKIRHRDMGFSLAVIATEISKLPDASEPLRARIKELESERDELKKAILRERRFEKEKDQRDKNTHYVHGLEADMLTYAVQKWMTARHATDALLKGKGD